MMGGGGRSTGAGVRMFSIDSDRNTLFRGLVDGETGTCDVTGDVTAAAAPAELSADVTASG